MNTNSDLSYILEELIDYIELNIKENITLNELSTKSNLSKFHLIRVFKNLTDKTIMGYVNSRKLARSLTELFESDMRIVDIALNYGFEHEQSYIRTFKKEFGITPGKSRKGHSNLVIVDKMKLDCCNSIGSGILFEPVFIVKPGFHLIGIKDIIVGDESLTKNTAKNRGADFFLHHKHKITNAINPNVYIGLTRLKEKAPISNCYMPALQVSSLDKIPEGMSADTIPAHKYAVFRYVGNHSIEEITLQRLMELHNFIDFTWMPKYNYDFFKEGGFFFELIDLEVSSENYCEVDLYFPFKNRSTLF